MGGTPATGSLPYFMSPGLMTFSGSRPASRSSPRCVKTLPMHLRMRSCPGSPSSLLYMPNRVAAPDLPETWCSSFPVLSLSGEPVWFHRSDALPCLGVFLSPYGRFGYVQRLITG